MRFVAWNMVLYMFLGSLFPGADFSQIPRLAKAYHHFQEHVQESTLQGQLFSATDFLQLHFFRPSTHHKIPHHNHHNLPFQSLDHLVVSIMDLPAHRLTPPARPILLIQKSIFFFLHPAGEDFSFQLFQPPVLSC